MKKQNYFYTTRELLSMAALAALGGITSTYLNMIGDIFQSFLGFAGTTQWAAGLHVIWLSLAMGLVRKPGAGILTGILKGAVEFLSGNTHGILVILVNIAAGFIIDLVFLFTRKKTNLPVLLLAGGLASVSNVFVFQLFASIPTDSLAFGALVIIAGLAFISGVILAGFLPYLILQMVQKTGFMPHEENKTRSLRLNYVLIPLAILLFISAAYIYLQSNRTDGLVAFSGRIANPYIYPSEATADNVVQVEATLNGATATYSGVLLKELIDAADPFEGWQYALLIAQDGYSFLLSAYEIEQNPNIILVGNQMGKQKSYDVAGPVSSKAWVRGVKEIVLVADAYLVFEGSISEPGNIDLNQWLDEMDSTTLTLKDGASKAQGISVFRILFDIGVSRQAQSAIFSNSKNAYEIALKTLEESEDIRIFMLMEQSGIRYVLGQMNGTVLFEDIEKVKIE